MRLDLRWLRHNYWILLTSLTEAGLTFAVTYVVLEASGASAELAATVAAICRYLTYWAVGEATPNRYHPSRNRHDQASR